MSRLRQALLAGLAGAVAAGIVAVAGPALRSEADAAIGPVAAGGNELRPVSAFDGIRDGEARAAALFEEAGKVIASPRCMNCHPAGDRPTQTDSMRPHQPLVVRGEADHGAAGLTCNTCHHDANFDAAGVPGNPKWAVAPIEMAWQGKSLGQICTQIKDRSRNGGKDMAALVHHMAEDDLVGWGWHPGAGRKPAPGTQKQFGELIKAWVEAGASCPGR